MAGKSHKTISLAEFSERALKGERIEQDLTDGTRTEAFVHAPGQDDLLEAQRLMVRIVQVADAATKKSDITDEDATLAYEVGLAALKACVRDEHGEPLPDAAAVNLFRLLPHKSAVMTRCQELCGVDMITVPPVTNSLALEAVRRDAAEAVAEAEAAAKPNRKSRRSTKAKAKTKRRSSEDNPALRSNQR